NSRRGGPRRRFRCRPRRHSTIAVASDSEKAGVENNDNRPADRLTAFAAAEASLVEQCGSTPCDAASFRRKLAPCSLGRCHGTCCYDGVHVDDDTAGVLQRLATERADDFRRMGVALPEAVIVHEQWRGSQPQAKTAVRPYPFKSTVKDYPSHFN